MSTIMALDGGGTKTLAILFDEDLNLLGMGRGGGMNTNFESMDVVKEHLSACIHGCLAAAAARAEDHPAIYGFPPLPRNHWYKMKWSSACSCSCVSFERFHVSLFGHYCLRVWKGAFLSARNSDHINRFASCAADR